jgi:PII-like signaling protein
MCQNFRGIDEDFYQFLDGSLTNVSFPSLSITEVPVVIIIIKKKNKINETNNKVVKSHAIKKYLTIFYEKKRKYFIL